MCTNYIYYGAISPKKIDLSEEQEAMIGSLGWKSTSLTEPLHMIKVNKYKKRGGGMRGTWTYLWPGSLYKIMREVVSQIYTNLSADPADTLDPSGDHEHRSRFFS
jgi:hypothetical protein